MCSAATAAWPSANTPARGVPTAATSPMAYTPSNRVSSVSGLTGIQPFSVIPDSSTTAGCAMDWHCEKQVEWHLAAVTERRDLP
jgi:hypothetical protein